MTIKQSVDKFVSLIRKPISFQSEKDRAVRMLGFGIALAKAGAALKKEAKKSLEGLGFKLTGVHGETTLLHDSEGFILESTKAADSRQFDLDLLVAALQKEKLSGAATTRIIEGSFKPKNGAVTLTVKEK